MLPRVSFWYAEYLATRTRLRLGRRLRGEGSISSSYSRALHLCRELSGRPGRRDSLNNSIPTRATYILAGLRFQLASAAWRSIGQLYPVAAILAGSPKEEAVDLNILSGAECCASSPTAGALTLVPMCAVVFMKTTVDYSWELDAGVPRT